MRADDGKLSSFPADNDQPAMSKNLATFRCGAENKNISKNETNQTTKNSRVCMFMADYALARVGVDSRRSPRTIAVQMQPPVKGDLECRDM
jgi:hypothetical protein